MDPPLEHMHWELHTDLALLVAVRQKLQAVRGDGQELGVALLQQGNHLLQAVGQADRHLGSFLVQQQVVERGDGVEEHRLHGGAVGGKRVKSGSQTADAQSRKYVLAGRKCAE